MPRIPILRLRRISGETTLPSLTSYTPAVTLKNLQLGVDNLRHDVHLSPSFIEQARLHVARIIARHAGLEGLFPAEPVEKPREERRFLHSRSATREVPKLPKIHPAALKPLLTELHVCSLNAAKALENSSVDLLARVAILKFLRIELNTQFAQLLERGRMTVKSYEGVRQQKALEYREKVAAFQIAKKIILRKAGQELFRILREIEKETLLPMRRSLFGNQDEASYLLFLNPLIFTEDGRDTYLNAEHYVMLGNFDRDVDRFSSVRRIVCDFLLSLNLQTGVNDSVLDGWLNVPENSQELLGSRDSEPSTEEDRGREKRLSAWIDLLERKEVMDHVIASYEVVSLLSEYSPFINPQQLKHALISREERVRVEKLIEEHGKLSSGSLYAAMKRVVDCRADERGRVGVRFMRDFLRYHRDLRRLEAVNEALDSVNLVGNPKIRNLSAMNGSLHEFLLPEEQKPKAERILNHVIVKADVRDSSRLTRSLLEREMNPASYFSLNFYEPVNKLLEKYGARKVFVEGDAIILALLEHKAEASLAVSRACVLAREIIEIVRGYNELLQRTGLPGLELGIGISFQDSAPMYLMDGEQQIMISEALNESDRLSSCSRRVRKAIERMQSPFNVYSFQTIDDKSLGESSEELFLKYNLNGVCISEAAFKKLGQEISLETCNLELPELWGSEGFRLYCAVVPIGTDIFRKILVRASRVAQIDPATFSLQGWTEKWYYEICSNPALYAMLERKAAAGK
jgi:hypothetical protein